MSRIPRNHYLVLHDALRRFLGPDAQLAAFVKAKHTFQCDMLVNHARTDPLELRRVGGLRDSSSSSSSSSSSGTISTSISSVGEDRVDVAVSKAGVVELARALQEQLGTCDVVPHTRRIDVVFRDRSVVQLALGAAARDLPFALESGADVNQEPDWRLRNRLRISLGFDEELFLSQCPRSVNVAARVLEKSMFDSAHHSALLSIVPAMVAMYEAHGRRLLAVLPPVSYWLAHCYALTQAYPCRTYQQIVATVEHNFARYYGEYPMLNPYCAGEDLNTIEVVQWLCEAHNAGAAAALCDTTASTMDVALVGGDCAFTNSDGAASASSTVAGGVEGGRRWPAA
ncbi:hypothetical protein NESM_000211500 [Novymonas esmeraldas]|uniref:Uncharacterized protein n=1 Tax=Novymonas esmeraldas TaxID=1808958 RepID=A0AAW0F720_9TRYP